MAEPAVTAHSNQSEVDALISNVRDWPPMQRLRLVQALLKTLEPEIQPRQHRKVTAAEATGLLASAKPAPSDDQVERLATEYLSEKYG